MQIYGKSDIGLVRRKNEDALNYTLNGNEDLLALLCDGVGGNKGGEKASLFCVRSFSSAFEQNPDLQSDMKATNWIKEQTSLVNDQIRAMAEADPALEGMSTTLAGFLLCAQSTYIFHAGDSRIYGLYGRELIQLSLDHVIHDPQRESEPLTSCLGIWDLFMLDLHKIRADYSLLLLCSDGLHRYVSKEDIKAVLFNHQSLPEKVNALLLEARKAGGKDNCSVILLERGPYE